MNGLKGIKRFALAVLKGILFFLAGVIIFSAVFYFFTVNETYIPIVRSGLVFLTAFITGLWSSKGETSKGYLRGLASGLILAVLFITASKIFGESPVLKSVVTYLIMIVIATIGGIIGINVK